MRRLVRAIRVGCALLVCAHTCGVSRVGLAAAQTAKHTPTVQEWISLKNVDAPHISPDGGAVAYVVQEPVWGADSFDNEIWIASTETAERRQLTSGKGASWNPRWSLDSRHIAFLSSRDGAPQIYLILPSGGEVTKLTQVENGVGSFEWSPDGHRIAYTTSEPRAHDGGKPKEEAKEFRVVGEETVWTTCLWVIEVASDERAAASQPERLTDGVGYAADDFSWSPDSRYIAFDAYEYAAQYPFWTYDIYVIEVGSKSVKKIVGSRGPDFFPVWSPDGREIAYRTYVRPNSDDDYYTYSNGFIAVVPADGGVPRLLTGQFDENTTPLAWSPEGIYFAARQKTYQHLFRLDPATKAITRVSEPFVSMSFSFSFTKDFSRVAYHGADVQGYQEIYVSPLKGRFERKRLTAMGEQLKDFKLATREIVEWKSKDRTPVEGVLVKPADFDPSKKYPLIVIIHGGPADADQAVVTRDLPYPAEMFAAKGALVLRPNYRGSTGYGQKFRAAVVRGLGVGEYEDIIAGVDYLVARGIVDPERIGAMGWSHGGYLAAFITTYSDRFKAVAVGAGVAEWRTFYAHTGGSAVKPDYRDASPWDDPDHFRLASPLTYIKRAKTPTLIQHGEFDPTAPIVGAYELYYALKDQGVPVKMIVYKGTGHLPSGLRQIRAVIEHNLDWFDRWIWGNAKSGD